MLKLFLKPFFKQHVVLVQLDVLKILNLQIIAVFLL